MLYVLYSYLWKTMAVNDVGCQPWELYIIFQQIWMIMLLVKLHYTWWCLVPTMIVISCIPDLNVWELIVLMMLQHMDLTKSFVWIIGCTCWFSYRMKMEYLMGHLCNQLYYKDVEDGYELILMIDFVMIVIC